MTKTISVENIGKEYRLGLIGARSFSADFLRWRNGRKHSVPAENADSVWALRNINFEVEQGESLGIIGRNGAGKSTLLKILSRITTPTEGVFKVKGRLASLLEVGTGFHPELTGRENVFLNGAILGMGRAEVERKFDEIVDFSGVEKFIDTPVKHYSSGMYVRLAFAVAAHLEPEILVVDEVLAVGDAEFQKKCLGKMDDSTKNGKTVLFVSHNLSAVARLCPRAILLTHGNIMADGPSEKTIATYYDSLRKSDEKDEFGNRIVKADVGFVNWSVGDLNDVPVHQLYSQGPLEINLLIESKRAVQGVNFGIAVYTANEQLLWSLSTKNYEGGRLDLPQGRHVLSFNLPSFPVRPGDYQLLVAASTLQEGTLDEWSDTLVVLSEYNETKAPEKWRGILNIPGKFHLESATS